MLKLKMKFRESCLYIKVAGSRETPGYFGLIVYHESNSYDLKQSFDFKDFLSLPQRFETEGLVDTEHHGSVGIDRGGMF